jgi:glutamyl/glutaminyl-tRNA synthetase
MMANTRFCMTANGPAHLGHLMTILVNYHEAHETGGKFIFRFDDNQRVWKYLLGENAIESYMDLAQVDLDWLGIVPDVWSEQSELLPQAIKLASRLGYEWPDFSFADMPTVEMAGSNIPYYPLTESDTIQHVFDDFIEGVTFCLRGEDLLTEACLYQYFVKKYQLPRVRLGYLRRLDFTGGEVVSKTAGNFKLCAFRDAGIDPQILIKRLAIDCLVDPAKGWRFANVKQWPVLGEWAEDAL